MGAWEIVMAAAQNTESRSESMNICCRLNISESIQHPSGAAAMWCRLHQPFVQTV
jgi:hypothetical protein